MTFGVEIGYQAAHARLCELCPVGTTVYTVLRGRARSGLSYTLDLYTFHCNGERPVKHYITALVAVVLNYRRNRSNSAMVLKEPAVALVYSLSIALHGMTDKHLGTIAPHEGACITPSDVEYRAGHTLQQEWI